MTRRSGLQEVELLDGDDEPAEQPGPPARSRRRLWWIAAGAVAVALALVGTQLVVDAREEAAYQRLAAVPGVFPPLGDELVVLRRLPEVDAPASGRAVEIGGGRTVGLVVADDGSQSFGAVDQRTGETALVRPAAGSERGAGRVAAATGTAGGAWATRLPASRRRQPSAWSRTASCATTTTARRSGCPRPPAG